MASEYVPVENRPHTILGTILSTLFLVWLAVSLRLYVRLRNNLRGWDDFFVVAAALATTAATVFVCMLPAVGMGKHYETLSAQKVADFFRYVYASNLCYVFSASVIKLALLFQYLHLFDQQSRLALLLTRCLIVLIMLWGTVFAMVLLFGCSPISATWNLLEPGHCIGFGSRNLAARFRTFAAHSSTNMCLDLCVLLLPLPFLRSLVMRSKTKLGITALFVMGAIVLAFSIARLVNLIKTRVGTYPHFDPTWAAGPIYFYSILEINGAIVTASIPIFWPMLVALASKQILVVHEVEVRSSRRSSLLDGSARAHADDLELHAELGAKATARAVPKAFDSARLPASDALRTEKVVELTPTLPRGPPAHPWQPSLPSSGRCPSHDSTRPLASRPSAHSLGSIATTASAASYTPGSAPLAAPPTAGSADAAARAAHHYQDRFVHDWACPDFDRASRAASPTSTARPPAPFDYLSGAGSRR